MDKAVSSEGVIDIFDAAGIKKPNLSILSDEFLGEIRYAENKNLAMELLKKILNDEIKIKTKRNLVKNRKFSEMLDAVIKKYQKRLITTVEVIEELIKLAEEIKAYEKEKKKSGLSSDETAFYDTLSMNKSAREVLKDRKLQQIAKILVQRVKDNTSIDWAIKQTVRAKLRTIVRRTLKEYGYPPDEQKMATDNILKQAELFARDWEE